MIRVLRDFRLLPLVLIATVSLLALKSLGLLLDGSYVLAPPAQQDTKPPLTESDGNGDIVASATPGQAVEAEPQTPPVTAPLIPIAPGDLGPGSRQSWAQEMFNYPDITGAIGGSKKETAPPKPGPTTVRDETAIPPDVRTATRAKPLSLEQRAVSPSERAILERLQDRRKDLEARARKLDMRESLLKAEEKRLEGRVTELKQVQERIKVAQDRKEDANEERFKGLVAMYENMKAKDAARIFDRLDMKILVSLAGQINPRRMADILANMSPEAAERLTVEFASRGNGQRPKSAADLPKIEGRPTPGP